MNYGDLGENGGRLVEKVKSNKKYKTFVDVGVRTGISSRILLQAAELNDGHVFGIDWTKKGITPLNQDFMENSRYTFIRSESVSAVEEWNRGTVDVVFLDATHIDSYVLCELYYWWDLLNVDGIIGFHDTDWPQGQKTKQAPIRDWGTPREAVKKFFNIDSLNYEDEYIHSEHYKGNWGLTIVRKKSPYDYKSDINNWEKYFKDKAEIKEWCEKTYAFDK